VRFTKYQLLSLSAGKPRDPAAPLRRHPRGDAQPIIFPLCQQYGFKHFPISGVNPKRAAGTRAMVRREGKYPVSAPA
jgi:hypothetical protein